MSELQPNENSIVNWSERIPDMKVRFPLAREQIPDVIVYLATGHETQDRICYIRIPAQEVLDINNESDDIQKYSLQVHALSVNPRVGGQEPGPA